MSQPWSQMDTQDWNGPFCNSQETQSQSRVLPPTPSSSGIMSNWSRKLSQNNSQRYPTPPPQSQQRDNSQFNRDIRLSLHAVLSVVKELPTRLKEVLSSEIASNNKLNDSTIDKLSAIFDEKIPKFEKLIGDSNEKFLEIQKRSQDVINFELQEFKSSLAVQNDAIASLNDANEEYCKEIKRKMTAVKKIQNNNVREISDAIGHLKNGEDTKFEAIEAKLENLLSNLSEIVEKSDEVEEKICNEIGVKNEQEMRTLTHIMSELTSIKTYLRKLPDFIKQVVKETVGDELKTTRSNVRVTSTPRHLQSPFIRRDHYSPVALVHPQVPQDLQQMNANFEKTLQIPNDNNMLAKVGEKRPYEKIQNMVSEAPKIGTVTPYQISGVNYQTSGKNYQTSGVDHHNQIRLLEKENQGKNYQNSVPTFQKIPRNTRTAQQTTQPSQQTPKSGQKTPRSVKKASEMNRRSLQMLDKHCSEMTNRQLSQPREEDRNERGITLAQHMNQHAFTEVQQFNQHRPTQVQHRPTQVQHGHSQSENVSAQYVLNQAQNDPQNCYYQAQIDNPQCYTKAQYIPVQNQQFYSQGKRVNQHCHTQDQRIPTQAQRCMPTQAQRCTPTHTQTQQYSTQIQHVNLQLHSLKPPTSNEMLEKNDGRLKTGTEDEKQNEDTHFWHEKQADFFTETDFVKFSRPIGKPRSIAMK